MPKYIKIPDKQFKPEIRILVISVFFILFDFILLSLPPYLKISFGSPVFSIVSFSAVRIFLFGLGIFFIYSITKNNYRKCNPDALNNSDEIKDNNQAQIEILKNDPVLVKHKTKIPGNFLPGMIFFSNLLLLICEIDGFYIEPFNLQTTNLKMPADIWAMTSTNPSEKLLRLVQLSDIHIKHIPRREQVLITKVNEQKPDIIVLTGDYLNLSYLEDPGALQEAHDLLAQFHAPLGVYAISGNIDSPEHMENLFKGLNITVLDDEIARIGDINVIGINYRSSVKDSELTLKRLVNKTRATDYTLLLYHTSDLINEASKENIDLYLSGHTHGGQIRLPFYGAIITLSKQGKKYEAGKYTVGNTTLYVSRGIGLEGWIAPRARFLCPPEIVVIDFYKPYNQPNTFVKLISP
jgi:predicted MPP superfamily phosphohydrolase